MEGSDWSIYFYVISFLLGETDDSWASRLTFNDVTKQIFSRNKVHNISSRRGHHCERRVCECEKGKSQITARFGAKKLSKATFDKVEAFRLSTILTVSQILLDT